jgi:hypothetical protein
VQKYGKQPNSAGENSFFKRTQNRVATALSHKWYLASMNHRNLHLLSQFSSD